MELDRPTFLEVVRNAPLVSIDLIVRNGDGAVLLGLRSNEPARGMWFVPGGRIRKGERIAEAIGRISREEIGAELPAEDGRFLGVFEHIYESNFAGQDGFGTHYVVLAYEFLLGEPPAAMPADQHSQFRWAAPAELLADEHVHPNTKAYFRPAG